GENPIERTRRLQSGCHLVANYLLEPLFPRVADVLADSSVDESVRQIAARTLAIHRESPAIQGLGVLAGKPLPAALQAQVESALESVLAATSEDQEKQLKTLVASVTLNLQQEIALEMSLERKGAELMARFLQTGTMSGRVLLNAQVQQRLLASLDQETASKLKQILDALPPVSQERDQTIAALREDYRKGSHSVEAGQKLFETKCAACHQLAGKGKVIGPQLDGIGNRGLQRLLEDIIDPNRNVDVAFRSRVYALEDGRVLTGVFRREEGQSVIIADNKGEEIAFPKSAIEEQKSSTVSIMPDNWGTSLTPEELCGVVAFLLEQRQRVENN
ncbi:MAG: c-type cytochrome, partial [Planctomycetaceae bacterium]|nr:c-type cytochrome [Planctomycetaceae bacterium]